MFAPIRAVWLCAAAIALHCASSFGQVDDPEGNQECGTTCNFSTSSAVCGTAQSTFFSSNSDKTIATSDALADLKRKLCIASGVVCMNCDDGLQCYRSGDTGAGTFTSLVGEIPGGTEQTHGWMVTTCFTGNYTVTCAACPEE